MSNRKFNKIILVLIPCFILLVCYMIFMGILGENAKVVNQSKGFIEHLINNDYSEAFKLMSEDYQREFFDEPLIFKITLILLNEKFDSLKFDCDVELKSSNQEGDLINHMIDMNSEKKKMAFIKKGFSLFPWQRESELLTNFAIPGKPLNRFNYFFKNFVGLYCEDILSQFEKNSVNLEKDENHWKISNFKINNVTILNLFMQEDFWDSAKSFSPDELKFEELIKLTEILREKKVDNRIIAFSYDLIKAKSEKLEMDIKSKEGIE